MPRALLAPICTAGASFACQRLRSNGEAPATAPTGLQPEVGAARCQRRLAAGGPGARPAPSQMGSRPVLNKIGFIFKSTRTNITKLTRPFSGDAPPVTRSASSDSEVTGRMGRTPPSDVTSSDGDSESRQMAPSLMLVRRSA